MPEESYLVHPTLPTRYDGIETIRYPPTDTLALTFINYCVWLLPTWIDITRYNAALAQALTMLPPVAGRLCKHPDEGSIKGDMYLKLTNSGIPVSVVDDYATDKFPMDLVILHQNEFENWVDPIPAQDSINGDEPLLRVKFTKLHKTGQMVYAASWSHGLGDAFTSFLFGTYVSHFYRGASVESLPEFSITKVFFPPPPSDPKIVDKFLPLMKDLRGAKPGEEIMMAMMQSEERTSAVNLHFTLQQIQTLAKIAVLGAPDPSTARVSKTDVLIAYLVLRLNEATAAVHPNQTPIDTIVNTRGYRGNPKFAEIAMLGNAAIMLTSPPFIPPPPPTSYSPRGLQKHLGRSLYTIATSIRAGTLPVRDPEYLETYLQFHNELCRKLYQENLFQNLLPASDREITFNSTQAFNARLAADFYEPDSEYANGRCTTFHTNVTIERYIRLMPANPVFVPDPKGQAGEGTWDLTLADGGLEAAFRVDKSVAEIYVSRVKKDLEHGFENIFATL